jgi:CubicO group peptidase (beta-lactamase class C family)
MFEKLRPALGARFSRVGFALCGAVALATALGLALTGTGTDMDTSVADGPPVRNVAEFADRLEKLRQEVRIPAYSAAIAKGDRVVWSKGFGMADWESSRTATPETIYHIASLTKTFASTVILQLVEEGKIDLEAPVSHYGVQIPNADVVRVKHVLSHTSDDPPGTKYRYDGNRFAVLETVIAAASGHSFAELACRRIILPLKLTRTAPNVRDAKSFAFTQYDRALFERDLAKPYELSWRGKFQLVEYPALFNCSGGMISSAVDVANYSIALDQNKLLKPASLARAFTPAKSTDGKDLPYGLGWFVSYQDGIKLVWHYGMWTANSALIVKFPEKRLTFVLLASSDRLSRPFKLGAAGQLMNSPFARAFVTGFVTGDAPLSAPLSD